MTFPVPENNGPKKITGPIRNLKFLKKIDDFLIEETGSKKLGKKGRTTLRKADYIEKAIARLMAMKPKDRDIEMSKYFNDGFNE